MTDQTPPEGRPPEDPSPSPEQQRQDPPPGPQPPGGQQHPPRWGPGQGEPPRYPSGQHQPPPGWQPEGAPPHGNWWSRRSIGAKAGIIIGSVVLVLAVIGAAVSPPPDDETDRAGESTGAAANRTTDVSEEESAQAVPEETEAPEPTPTPRPTQPQPSPRTVEGAGQQVKAVRLRTDGPMVVTASHRGQSNFIVDLVPRGGGDSENLYNEIGDFKGQALVEDAASGRYRLRVEADGPWTLRLSQPLPSDDAKKLPGRLSGRGAKVVRVRVDRDTQPTVKATHRGDSNFIVDIVGYGDQVSGSENLYNEIGNYRGETLMDELPAGDYLVNVQADGRWSLRFSNE